MCNNIEFDSRPQTYMSSFVTSRTSIQIWFPISFDIVMEGMYLQEVKLVFFNNNNNTANVIRQVESGDSSSLWLRQWLDQQSNTFVASSEPHVEVHLKSIMELHTFKVHMMKRDSF